MVHIFLFCNHHCLLSICNHHCLFFCSTRKSFYPRQASGQAVVIGVFPSPTPVLLPPFCPLKGLSIATFQLVYARRLSLKFAQLVELLVLSSFREISQAVGDKVLKMKSNILKYFCLFSTRPSFDKIG